MTRAAELAWAAGLFEGEGWMNLSRPKYGPRQPQVGLSMTDRDVVEKFMEVMGCGKISIHDSSNPRHKRQYRWRVCGWGPATTVLALLKPHLCSRRQQQIEAVEAERSRPRMGQQPKPFCKHGHAMTQENTRVVKQRGNNGVQRQCRTCDRERKRRVR